MSLWGIRRSDVMQIKTILRKYKKKKQVLVGSRIRWHMVWFTLRHTDIEPNWTAFDCCTHLMEPNGLCPGEKTAIRFVPSDSVAARLEGREMQRFCRIFFLGGGRAVMISSDWDRDHCRRFVPRVSVKHPNAASTSSAGIWASEGRQKQLKG